MARIIKFRKIAREAYKLNATSSRFDYILIDCFMEYFSVFWFGPYQRLSRMGIPIGVIAHDPVRNLLVGPRWWHDLSIRLAYSFVRDVFVHDAASIDFGGSKPDRIRITEIPHGTYFESYLNYDPADSRRQTRSRLNIQMSDLVFLSFGHIRDDKNLDLFIRSMPRLDRKIRLLVAGKVNSQFQKSADYYQRLAEDLEVSDRCHWILKYIPDEEIPSIFSAADYALLLYSKSFLSASGVLNSAAAFDLPVLASGGTGPLSKCLQEFNLGIWINELTEDNIVSGVNQLVEGGKFEDFSKYRKANSWARNANLVKEAIQKP